MGCSPDHHIACHRGCGANENQDKERKVKKKKKKLQLKASKEAGVLKALDHVVAALLICGGIWMFELLKGPWVLRVFIGKKTEKAAEVATIIPSSFCHSGTYIRMFVHTQLHANNTIQHYTTSHTIAKHTYLVYISICLHICMPVNK